MWGKINNNVQNILHSRHLNPDRLQTIGKKLMYKTNWSYCQENSELNLIKTKSV